MTHTHHKQQHIRNYSRNRRNLADNTDVGVIDETQTLIFCIP